MKRYLVPKKDWQLVVGMRLPIMYCPNDGCGQTLLGISTHEVMGNGEVNNSVICPLCNFHQFVTLQGWTGGAILRGSEPLTEAQVKEMKKPNKK